MTQAQTSTQGKIEAGQIVTIKGVVQGTVLYTEGQRVMVEVETDENIFTVIWYNRSDVEVAQ
jgi:hypothetical protein